MATDPKKTTEATPATHIYSKLYEIANSGDFESEQTGFAPYWKPNMFCTKCPAIHKSEPGRKLGDREFQCESEDANGVKHGKTALIGSAFLGRVMARDVKPQTDERTGEVKDFVRWLLLATRTDVPCFQGPTQEVERMNASPGQPFNVSDYETLKFQDFLGCEVLVIAKSKRAIKNGHTLWNFDLRVTKDMKRELDANRLAAAETARKMLAERARQRIAELTASTQAQTAAQATHAEETAQAVAE